MKNLIYLKIKNIENITIRCTSVPALCSVWINFNSLLHKETDDIPFVALMMSFDTSAYINKVVV